MERLEETHAILRFAGIDENSVPLDLAMKGKTDWCYCCSYSFGLLLPLGTQHEIPPSCQSPHTNAPWSFDVETPGAFSRSSTQQRWIRCNPPATCGKNFHHVSELLKYWILQHILPHFAHLGRQQVGHILQQCKRPGSTKHSGFDSPQTMGINMKKKLNGLVMMKQVHTGYCTSSLGFGFNSSVQTIIIILYSILFWVITQKPSR